ncbi:type VI secretion system baseplate subunit TssK [Caldimonas thermodepolymerans]|uniref:Type VI secretion system baseplate subunit TssK n=1 Tax=Caldimonas thermodepolymerans TaxID=215580 RepID=A0A2S5T6A3_9BURK|nr:type VI secretion system baseplate subunit TssK [Caldimonas thermodepolymerans]PPE70397.1 type VI secretion system baseplate subunit TssK [Caldimonas thermodepolymerans]QPC30304.1 type VI secretion system baseplate subunit TssK [Caldimonas thermodepolymerans]RDI00700.1 type VI secretion system protein ImpJ [Caldimonas thermodepolymerans]TCP07021.1 type VI secretion system protein ImpJ [Caldimonas thermodepolymerans]UZG43066.1 type VI secretion system baseplate subunit TssK [Caldimonas therm
MIHSAKVLWGEGLFLRPQHFQRQDAYHEWRLAQTARILHPYAWGLRHLKVDSDALHAGVLRVLELQVVFPDGELYRAPEEDELPPPVSLDGLSDHSAEATFHLAIAPLRSAGSNFVANAESPDAGVRYVQSNQEAPDWYTAAVTAEVSLLRKRARLLAGHEPRDHLVSLPVLRVRRTSSGSFELDGRFIPPCTSVQSSPALALMLRRLLDVLQAKVDALYGFHREPAKHVIEFRSGDVASFWLLHTASSSHAALSHLLRHPGLHPERLFQALLQLAGALLTFSKTFTLADLPSYHHADPGPAFVRLDHIIRELLETVISTRYFSIALSETKPSFHQGRLDAGQLTPSTSFYLGVAAAMPPAELVEAVPLRFKLGAPDDVDKLVLSAMPGIRLVHAPQVPAAVPVRPGTYYFALEPRGALYERMLQAQAVAIYAPQGWNDLTIELIAVNA